MKKCVLVILGISLAACYGKLDAADWTRFRGPNGSGVSTDQAPLPTEWSAEKNLQWKIELPGPGSSCPIVIGDRVIVTCWSGYGTDEARSAPQQELRRHLICVNRNDGAIMWQKTIEPVLPEDRFGGMFAEHGYASHTPCTDGENIYAFFGKTGALAFDLDGNQLWHTKLGTESDPRGWGSASSPILYEDLVIVTASAESEALVALDKTSGKEVWRQEARGFSGTWGTPILVENQNGEDELVLGVPYEFWGFHPKTGKLLWYCEVNQSDSYCSSVVAADGVIFGIEGRSGGSVAVRPGGKDDVSESHIVWKGRDQNRIGTPIVHDGLVYFFSSGVANCIQAKDGERIFRGRLQSGSSDSAARSDGGRGGFGGRGFGGRGGRGGGQDYASPILADGKIYFLQRGGDCHVIKVGSDFEQLAVNRLTDDREDFSATPAVSDGQLFIRSSRHLYCVSLAK